MSSKMDLKCGKHGKQPWNDDIICDHCGERWQCRSADEPRYAPQTCTCGKRLMPIPGNDKVPFTAAPLCRSCAQKPGEA